MALSEEEKEILRRADEIQKKLEQEQQEEANRQRIIRERELKRSIEQQNAQREIQRRKQEAMAAENRRKEEGTATRRVPSEQIQREENRLEEDIDKVPADFGEPVKKKSQGSANKGASRSNSYKSNRPVNSRKRKKKKRKSHPILLILLLLIVLAIVTLLVVHSLLTTFASMTNYQESTHLAVREADVYSSPKVKNILLIGTDARNSDETSRSDAMIVASINEKKKTITLSSILRDSYVEIPGYGWNRINAAYQWGGADLLINTIEHNFKIGIDSYVKVDFFSFIDLVNAVGGVDIDVDEAELTYVNGYLNEINALLGTPDANYIDPNSTVYGMMHLNGAQALAYSRIRYIGTDFQRTARQREVINGVVASAKTCSIPTLFSAAEIILPQLTTDINNSDMATLIMKALLYINYDMVEYRVPADHTWSDLNADGIGEVLQIDFETNIQMLRETVYGE